MRDAARLAASTRSSCNELGNERRVAFIATI